jgi:hypothetical protein
MTQTTRKGYDPTPFSAELEAIAARQREERALAILRERVEASAPKPTHKHSCPECYEKVPCALDCWIEPDLGDPKHGPMGYHDVCDACEQAKTNTPPFLSSSPADPNTDVLRFTRLPTAGVLLSLEPCRITWLRLVNATGGSIFPFILDHTANMGNGTIPAWQGRPIAHAHVRAYEQDIALQEGGAIELKRAAFLVMSSTSCGLTMIASGAVSGEVVVVRR